jgi:hypothetical protein
MKAAIMLLILSTGLAVLSCRNKQKDTNTNTTINADTLAAPDTSAIAAPPATVNDDSLRSQLKDATKDFPGVTATVNNGEVTLTGNITRDKLPRLMQSVQALSPKKVNNNLNIK